MGDRKRYKRTVYENAAGDRIADWEPPPDTTDAERRFLMRLIRDVAAGTTIDVRMADTRPPAPSSGSVLRSDIGLSLDEITTG